LAFLVLGMLIPGLALLPTVLDYGSVMFLNSEGNLTFKPERFAAIGDLLIRYLGMATFDVTTSFDVFKLAGEKSALTKVLMYVLKAMAVFQFGLILFFSVKRRKEPLVQKSLLLFGLTLLMALALFVLGNKHLSARTYILLFPFPVWLSLYAYQGLKELKPKLTRLAIPVLSIVAVTFALIAFHNQGDKYSFSANEQKIQTAIEAKDPSIFGTRRESLMDEYH